MAGAFTDSIDEEAALSWLETLGCSVLHGPDIATGEPGAERSERNYRDVALDGRLRPALVRLNPDQGFRADFRVRVARCKKQNLDG